MKRNKINHADQRVSNGSSYPRFRIGWECSTEADMGANGETYATVSYSTANGEPTKNNTHGRLQGITVEIKGVSMLVEFKVINIFDDSNPYLVLLGIDWATDMNGMINLKKWKMIF